MKVSISESPLGASSHCVLLYFCNSCIFVFAVSLCGSDGVALPKVVVSKPAALDASSPSPTIPLTLASTLQCVPTHVLKKFNRKDISKFCEETQKCRFCKHRDAEQTNTPNFCQNSKIIWAIKGQENGFEKIGEMVELAKRSRQGGAEERLTRV